MRTFVVLLACGLVDFAAPGAAEPAIRGLVVERVPEDSRYAEAGLLPGDRLLRWAWSQSDPPRSASGELGCPLDTQEIRFEYGSRGPVTFTGERDGEVRSWIVRSGYWSLETRPELAPEELVLWKAGSAESGEGPAPADLDPWRRLAERFRSSGRDAQAAWLQARITAACGRAGDWDCVDASVEAGVADARRAERPALQALVLELGARAYDRGDRLDRMKQAYTRALEIRRSIDPLALAVAHDLRGLGLQALLVGDTDLAERYYRQSLARFRELAPDTGERGVELMNLGQIASRRGNLSAAEDLFRRGLDLDSDDLSAEDRNAQYITLASIAGARGDADSAALYLEQALEIATTAGSRDRELLTLSWMASIEQSRGNLEAAERMERRVLEAREREGGRAKRLFDSRVGLADILRQAGKLDEARSLLLRARADLGKLDARSLEAVWSLLTLARVELAAGRLDESEPLFREALDLAAETMPGTKLEAETAHGLATLLRKSGRKTEAKRLYERALDALESQLSNLGGTDAVRSGFRANYAGYYQDYIELLIELGEPDAALPVLERSHARELLALLVEREVGLEADVSDALREERGEVQADYQRITTALLSEEDDTRRAALREELAAQRVRSRELESRIRAAAPRFAAIEYPRPLDLSQARDALDPGTLALAYSVGQTGTWLIRLGPGEDDYSVHRIDGSADILRERVERLRSGLGQPGPLRRGAVDRELAELGDALLSPAAAALDRAKRVLVVPDGPLWFLHFAALTDPRPEAQGRYLVESLPIHATASLTVFAELKARRRPDRPTRISAFGDPDYPATAGTPTPAEIASAVRGGMRLTPLPASRAEVETIRSLFPDSTAVFLGPDASEQRAKSLDASQTMIHFACHGLVEDAYPLDSGLALTVNTSWEPGQENGLLQAWEVFEQVRIDAELVTLSACETALGGALAGEGILGLTRAFQYAGARSVLASLWAVSDRSTEVLMQRFYRHLRDGATKDQALREAQLELLRGPVRVRDGDGKLVEIDATRPHAWAGFQLVGDWR